MICAGVSSGASRGAGSAASGLAASVVPALGPAMRLMLALAAARSRMRSGPTDAGSGAAVRALWDLAERYHPEQAWLAASWLRGERSLDELERQAPREDLAPALRRVFRPAGSAEIAHTPGFCARMASEARQAGAKAPVSLGISFA